MVERNEASSPVDFGSLLILGAGRLGSHLAFHLHQAGVPQVTLWNRSDRADVRAFCPSKSLRLGDPLERVVASAVPDAVLLAVSDQAIPSLGERLATQRLLPAHVPILHGSGALPSSVLQPLSDLGHPVGSFHPLKSFSGTPQHGEMKGIPIALEGALEAVAAGEALTQRLEGQSIRLRPGAKVAYHCGAVVASNLLVVLADVASQVTSMALETPNRALALSLLLPLMRGTLENLARGGPVQALTGPISRGDADVISAHLKYLEASETHEPRHLIADVYRLLSERALELAMQQGLAEGECNRIRDVLHGRGEIK